MKYLHLEFSKWRNVKIYKQDLNDITTYIKQYIKIGHFRWGLFDVHNMQTLIMMSPGVLCIQMKLPDRGGPACGPMEQHVCAWNPPARGRRGLSVSRLALPDHRSADNIVYNVGIMRG